MVMSSERTERSLGTDQNGETEKIEQIVEVSAQDAPKREAESSRKTVLIGVGSLFALLVVGFFVVSFRKPASDGGQREPVVKRSDRKSKAPFESKPLVGPLPDGRVAQVLSFVSAHRSAFAVASVAAVLAVAVAVYYLASKSQPEEDLLRQAEEAKRLQTEETERLKTNEAKKLQANEARRSQAAQRHKLTDKESTVIMASRWIAALVIPLIPFLMIYNQMFVKMSNYIGDIASVVSFLLSILFSLLMPLFLRWIFGIAILMVYLLMFYVTILLTYGALNQWKTHLQELMVHLVFQGVLLSIAYFFDIQSASICTALSIFGNWFIEHEYFGRYLLYDCSK